MIPQKQDDGSYRIPSESVAKFREFCDRYQVNALRTQHPRSAVKDPVAEADKLHAWLQAWNVAANFEPTIPTFTRSMYASPFDEGSS